MMGDNMNWLDNIRQRIDQITADVTGEARRETEEALTAAKQAEQYVADHAAALKPALTAILSAVTPELQAAAVQLLDAFVIDVERALGVIAAAPATPVTPVVTPPAVNEPATQPSPAMTTPESAVGPESAAKLEHHDL